jgi:hypothetical protein
MNENIIIQCKVKIRLNIFIIFFTVSLCLFTYDSNAQILQDTASLNLIKKGVDSLYNMKFNFSEDVYRKINQMYPEHPIVILFKGIMIYQENYPLLPSSPAAIPFEEDMRSCIRLCENDINPSYEVEYLLADLCARGLLLSFYSNNELNNEVFPLVKNTYHYIRRSFDFTGFYSDFFLFSGLYNYYREVYPKVHTIYRPIAFLFPKGSRLRGLKDMETASQNSILLKAEALSDLSYVYISYENNYQKALSFSEILHDLYPSNPEFMAEYIKNLLLMKKYDKAESLAKSFDSQAGNLFYQAQWIIYQGIIQEKKYHNYILAQQFYNRGIRDISKFGSNGNEYAAYAYFGLSRICDANKEKECRKIYRKQALKLAAVKKINFD